MDMERNLATLLTKGIMAAYMVAFYCVGGGRGAARFLLLAGLVAAFAAVTVLESPVQRYAVLKYPALVYAVAFYSLWDRIPDYLWDLCVWGLVMAALFIMVPGGYRPEEYDWADEAETAEAAREAA